MKERRLLERISDWETGGERTNHIQVDILVRSVMAHLRRLLNTRQGSVQIDAQFGVPDFTNIAGGLTTGTTRDIEEEIRRMVSKYEPRLKSPKVILNRDVTDVLSIHFNLSGMLEVDNREIPLQLSTIVGANGKVNVT
ncbi:MAG: type VI secretion system baseplate subunit TssE [Herbaspirillum sp.]